MLYAILTCIPNFKRIRHVCRIQSKYKCAPFSCSNSLLAVIFNFQS
jgi:hypothetical protein